MREILSRQPDVVGKIGGELGRFSRFIRDEEASVKTGDLLATAIFIGGIGLVAKGGIDVFGGLLQETKGVEEEFDRMGIRGFAEMIGGLITITVTSAVGVPSHVFRRNRRE